MDGNKFMCNGCNKTVVLVHNDQEKAMAAAVGQCVVFTNASTSILSALQKNIAVVYNTEEAAKMFLRAQAATWRDRDPTNVSPVVFPVVKCGTLTFHAMSMELAATHGNKGADGEATRFSGAVFLVDKTCSAGDMPTFVRELKILNSGVVSVMDVERCSGEEEMFAEAIKCAEALKKVLCPAKIPSFVVRGLPRRR